jgi:hypothetical protein
MMGMMINAGNDDGDDDDASMELPATHMGL